MSIAALSSSFVAAAREIAPPEPVAAVGAVRAGSGSGVEHAAGRRHELVDAMTRALGVEGAPTRTEAQAVFRFAHALMQDLRTLAGDTAAPGQPPAWGRREWSDLSQRLETLASAASAATPEPAPAAAPPAPAIAPAAPASSPALPAELPLQPNPVTATSAAVHLMQVPSSRLLEAYRALHQVLGAQADAAASSTPAPRADLASFLARLSSQLGPAAPAEVPSGSVLHVTA